MSQRKKFPIPKNNLCYLFDIELKKTRGYVVLDLKSGLTTTRRKVTHITVNKLVIKDVGNMAADNKTTTLNFENKSGVLLHPNYWLIGVDYEDKNANEIKDINDDETN